MKGAVAAAGALVPRTHMIADLIQAVPEKVQADLELVKQKLLMLDQLYIPTRYPDALPGFLQQRLPGKEHAEAALETARTCCELIREWIEARGQGRATT